MINHEEIAQQEQTCWACPEQYQGTLRDGRAFYFRYRYGWASLGVGATIDAAIADPAEVGTNSGDTLQGIFEDDQERQRVFAELYARRTAIHETPSAFPGAPPIRTHPDGTQEYGPYPPIHLEA